MALILTGFCGAGKSTLGKKCAEALSLPFFDTDHLMENRFPKKRISEIWNDLGSASFRKYESEVIFALEKVPCVIALGGGALLAEENQRQLLSLGVLVYLKGTTQHLFARVLQRGMPAFLDPSRLYEHFEEIAKSRFPLYEKCCHFSIDIDELSLEEAVLKILSVYAGK